MVWKSKIKWMKFIHHWAEALHYYSMSKLSWHDRKRGKRGMYLVKKPEAI